jgi:transposase, IS30 family
MILPCTIARTIGRARSTISDEIKRNTGGRGYRPRQAHELSQARRSLANSEPGKLKGNVLSYIDEKIENKWSPEQVAGRLMRDQGISISPESIYRYLRRQRSEKRWPTL